MKMFRGLPLKMAPDHGDDHDDDNELMLMIVVMVVLNVRNSMSETNYLTVPPDGAEVHRVCYIHTVLRSPLTGRMNRRPFPLMGRTTY